METLGDECHGLPFSEQGKLKEAIGYYSEALRIRSNSAKAHYNLGVALAKHDGAIRHLSVVLRIKPNFREAKRRLTQAQAKQCLRQAKHPQHQNPQASKRY